MPINPMQMMQLMKGSQNPQQMVLGMLESQAQMNPMYANLLSLAKTGKTGNIEDAVRAFVNANGGDFDKDFNAFRNQWGL